MNALRINIENNIIKDFLSNEILNFYCLKILCTCILHGLVFVMAPKLIIDHIFLQADTIAGRGNVMPSKLL